jgi:hypothetical protein
MNRGGLTITHSKIAVFPDSSQVCVPEVGQRCRSVAKVPPAASNDIAGVVVIVVSLGGNPATCPSREKHRTDRFARRVPAVQLRSVF